MRAAAAALLLAACRTAAPTEVGLIDRTVDPCDDFYQYACGAWLARTPIPAGRAEVAIYDSAIAESVNVLREIIDDAVAGKSKLAEAQQVKDFWTACNAAADPEAERVLAEELARIDAGPTAAAVARLQLLGGGIGPWTLGTGTLFAAGTDWDVHDSTLVALQLDQGGVVLAYAAYADESPEGVKLRATYHDHVARMLALAGGDAAGADAVLRIETALARASVDEQARRDPAKIDHLTPRRDLAALVPHFDWDAWLTALGRPDATSINIVVPGYYRALDAVLASSKPEELRAYLRWQLVHTLGPALPARFAAERQVLEAALTGAATPPPRDEACVAALDNAMGEALGALYVEKRFGPEKRRAAGALADRIIATFAADLDRLAWLDPATRAAAKEKLAGVGRKIGAPVHPRSFAGLALDGRSLARDEVAVALFNAGYWLRRAGTRPPRDEWLMRPQSLDAYYDTPSNSMVFPAAIFQPPFFAEGDAAKDWANVGWVMGHELTHGFDSEGRKYDAGGMLRSWWTPASEAAFAERAACVIAQYDAYETVPGVHLDGKSELTENIADIGAMKLSYEAFVATRGPAPPEADRAFFMAVAQGGCVKTSEAKLRATAGGVHAPWRWRNNGPMADLPAFAKAFHCPAGKPMAPAKPCEVW